MITTNPDTCPPEVPFERLAAGNLEGLSRPIWLAAFSDAEVAGFRERYGLETEEVVRIRHIYQVPATAAGNKVLLRTATAMRDAGTARLLSWWVRDCDRYTFELDPAPWDLHTGAGLVVYDPWRWQALPADEPEEERMGRDGRVVAYEVGATGAFSAGLLLLICGRVVLATVCGLLGLALLLAGVEREMGKEER